MKPKPIFSMLSAVLLAGAMLLSGCATTNQNPYNYQGAGLGAAVGAAIGAGTNAKNPWKGAAIGGLLGGAAGYVAGEVYGRANPYPPQQGHPYGSQQPAYGYAPNPGYNSGPYGTANPAYYNGY